MRYNDYLNSLPMLTNGTVGWIIPGPEVRDDDSYLAWNLAYRLTSGYYVDPIPQGWQLVQNWRMKDWRFEQYGFCRKIEHQSKQRRRVKA